MSIYTLRVTIICPDAMCDDANAFAACLGFGPADLNTFKPSLWRDALGNLYGAASTVARADFPDRAFGPLTRPEWDVKPYQVNMAGAARAQQALVVWSEENQVAASPERLLAIIDPEAMTAIQHAGVEPVPSDI